jgi:Ca2+-binding EF-hand superfamily protein
MVDTQEVIQDVVAQQLSFEAFTSRYKLKPSGEKVYDFFQNFLTTFHSELVKASKSGKAVFQVSPNNRIKFLETRNENLEDLLKKYKEEEKKIKSYESESLKRVMISLPKMVTSAIKIQAFWRGIKTRYRLPKIVASVKRHPKRQMNFNEKVVFDVKIALSKIYLTLENAYRACDVGGDGIVTTEEFKRFLEKLRLKVGKNTIMQFIEILDENCSGSIERDEFYDCLDAFAVASENHFAYGEPYSRRILRKFKQLINENKVNVFEMFHKNQRTDQMSVDDFFDNLKRKFELLSREVQALTVLFDPGRTGFIKFFEYNSVLESVSVSIPENEPDKSLYHAFF